MQQIINNISDNIVELFREVLDSPHALNTKSNTTLKNSHLFDDAMVKYSEQGDKSIFDLLYYDYLQYIESGRKPFANKVPIAPLLKWMKEKGISTDNNVVYAIRESIYQQGIKARSILDPFGKLIDNQWDKQWSDDIYNFILNKLDKYFNK